MTILALVSSRTFYDSLTVRSRPPIISEPTLDEYIIRAAQTWIYPLKTISTETV